MNWRSLLAVIAIVLVFRSRLFTKETEENQVLEAFLDLADRVYEVRAVHMEFRSEFSDRLAPDPKKYVGFFDYDADNARAYMKVTEMPQGLMQEPITRYYSWDGRIGFSKRVVTDAKERRRYPVKKSDTPPRPFGYTQFPSDHLYYAGLLSLRTRLEFPRKTVERVLESKDLFRLAVGLADSKEEAPESWHVYLLQKTSDGLRVKEERLYFVTLPPDFSKDGTPPIAPGLELPEEYRANFLHARKIYHKYKSVNDLPFPVHWEVEIPATNGRATIEIGKILVDDEIEFQHEFSVPVADDELIFDTVERRTYSAGDPEHDVQSDGMVNEVILNQLLRDARAEFAEANSEYPTAFVPTGCAADCTYIVLATLGNPCPLQRIVSGLGIRPGEPFVDLKTVSEFVETQSIKTLALTAKKEPLKELPSQVR